MPNEKLVEANKKIKETKNINRKKAGIKCALNCQ